MQQAVKEALKVGAYPVNTLRLGKGAAIGRSECEGVWRYARWQQYCGLVDAVEQSGCDLLDWLDAGQNAAVCH